MRTVPDPESDKELWRRLAAGGEAVSDTVSDLDFAAWLEGRLPPDRVARVEAAIAADPEIRRAALELAEILGQPWPAAPSRMEVRAKALVGFEAERQKRRFGLLEWLFSAGPRFGVQRAATLAAAVAIAISGFMLGGGLGESVAQERFVTHASPTVTTIPSDPIEFLGSDGI